MSWDNNLRKWQFNRTFSYIGTYAWNATCTKNGYQTQTASSTITIKSAPIINSNLTIPSTPAYHRNLTITANITDQDNNIIWANFTLVSPSGIYLINHSNGTSFGDWWNSSSINLTEEYTWEWWINVTDADGFTASSYGSFFIDGSPPGISLHYPDSNYAVAENSVNFNWTVIDNVDANLTCNLTVGSSVYPDISALNSTPANYTLSLDDGIYHWNISCRDDAGNVNISETRNFTIDTSPPSISLDSPSNNTWQNTSSVLLAYTATDLSGIDTCILYGNFSGTWLANFTNSTPGSGIQHSFELNLSSNNYLWNVWCNDTLGNAAFNATNYTLHVDYINPIISLNTPDNYATSNDYIVFNWTALDNLYHNLTCNLTLNGRVNVSDIQSFNGTSTLQNITGLNEGRYDWNITCWDITDNINISETRRAVVDFTSPWGISLFSPTPENNTQGPDNVVMNWTVFDNLDAAPECYFVVDDALNENKTSANGTYSDISVSMPGGWHNISIRCLDDAGNSNTSEIRAYMVGKINITSPEDNLVIRKNTPLRISVSEIFGQDFLDNVTVDFYNISLQLINTSDSDWYIDTITPDIEPDYADITAYSFANNAGSENSVTDSITIKIARPDNNTSLPQIIYLCPNQTYILNSSTARIDVVADLDTIVKESFLDVNSSLLSAFRCDYINVLNYTYSNSTPGMYTISFNITDIENNSISAAVPIYISANASSISLSGESVANLDILDVCSGRPISSGSSISYIVPDPVVFDLDVVFDTEPKLLSFRGVNSTGEVNVSMFERTNETPAPDGERPVDVFDIVSDIEFRNYTLIYNYSDIGFTIVDPSELKLWKCNNVSACILTEQAININSTSKQIIYEGSSLSRFMITEPIATDTVTITTTTSSSSGGAGSPIKMYPNDTIVVRIAAVNNGEIDFDSIDVDIKSENISAEPKNHIINGLSVNRSSFFDIKIQSREELGTYVVNVVGESKEPSYAAETNVLVTIIEKETTANSTKVIEKVKFAYDLFKENPECLEFQDMILQAEEAIEREEFEKAGSLLEASINACKETVTSLNQFDAEKKSPEKLDIVRYIPLFVIFCLVIWLVMEMWSRKPTKMARIKRR